MPRPLLTVGYGNRELDDMPAFSKHNLAAAVEKMGIRYVFMGDVLGGRPDDECCYDEAGHVDYLACREYPDFRGGFERLRSAFEQDAGAAIPCSELRPEQCHRTKLIAEAMAEMGVPVVHIDADGSLAGHDAVMERLQDAQMSLLGVRSEATRSRGAIAAL